MSTWKIINFGQFSEISQFSGFWSVFLILLSFKDFYEFSGFYSIIWILLIFQDFAHFIGFYSFKDFTQFLGFCSVLCMIDYDDTHSVIILEQV